jgi:hypothetical protein
MTKAGAKPVTNLSFLFESIWETSNVIGKLALVRQELNISTINSDSSSSFLLEVLISSERGEAPVLADDDLLTAGELVLGAAESFEGGSTVGITGSETENDLANVDTGDRSVGFTPSSTHTSLKSIGTGA